MSNRSNCNSKKRPYPSTTSEFDSNTSALDKEVFSETSISSSHKSKRKTKKKQDQKQRKMDDFVKNKESSPTQTCTEIKPSSVEKKIDEINQKLSQMLTKSDKSFIKEIIKSTIEEMKDQILKSVTRRIEILEGDIHEKCVVVEKYKQEIESKSAEIKTLKEENQQLKVNLNAESKVRENDINELEQYGRRNNIRINGIDSDDDKQPSATVAQLVVKTLNEKGRLNLKTDDIDIAHRLGRREKGKNRAVIVKFVRRETKISVMKCAKHLRQDRVFVNEDLTWLNQQVLSSLRLKDPNNVSKCWSFEGKLFVVYKDSTSPTEIKHKDFDTWLTKPWPKR